MKPSIYRIAPFDATVGTTISLAWNGRQQKSNVVIIENNTTHAVVYSATQSSYKGIHTVPANSGLVNGVIYRVKAAVIDMDDVQSEWSEYVTIKCFLTPEFGFVGISDEIIIEASNIRLEIQYSQAQNELLNRWQVYLYNASQVVIDTSEEKYYADTLTHTFSGLADASNYYVRGVGETVNGMPVDTGYIHIQTNYGGSAVFLNLEAINNPDEGNILIQSNAISIDGIMDHEPPVFINDSSLNLADNGVTFVKAFSASSDFTITMKVRQLQLYKDFFKITMSSGESLSLALWKTRIKNGNSTSVVYQIRMKYDSQEYRYSLWSNELATYSSSGTAWYGVVLRRKNNLYSLRFVRLT